MAVSQKLQGTWWKHLVSMNSEQVEYQSYAHICSIKNTFLLFRMLNIALAFYSFLHLCNFSFCLYLLLQTVQIMIGMITLLFGIAMVVYADTLGIYSGFFIWGASMVSQPYSELELLVPYCPVIYWLISVDGVSNLNCNQDSNRYISASLLGSRQSLHPVCCDPKLWSPLNMLRLHEWSSI